MRAGEGAVVVDGWYALRWIGANLTIAGLAYLVFKLWRLL